MHMKDSNDEAMIGQHLTLVHADFLPEELLDPFCTEIEAEGLNLLRKPIPSMGIQASLEIWTIPAIMFFISKAYFDGFLKEAGRRHYRILEDALGRFWKRLFHRSDGVRFAVLRSDGEVKTEYSQLFGIYAEVKKRKKLKLVFRNGCSEQEYRTAIRVFLCLLDSYHRGLADPDATVGIDHEEGRWGQVVVTLDPETETLRVVRMPSEVKSERPRKS